MQASESLLHGLTSLLGLGVSHGSLVQELVEILSSIADAAAQFDKLWSTTPHSLRLQSFFLHR
jgi:hypothetical protein